MEKIIFRLALPALLLTTLMLITSSCEQQEEGPPHIIAEEIKYNSCCGNIILGEAV